MSIIYYSKQEFSKELFMERLVYSPPPVIAVDVETVSLKERMPLGFAIATSPDEAFYFNVYPEPEPEVALVIPLLKNPNIKKVFHNALFDLRALPLIDGLEEIDRSNIADTNIMALLQGILDRKLHQLAPYVGKFATPADEILKPGQTMMDIPNEKRAEKCCNDAQVTLALYHYFLPKTDPEYFKVEMEVIPILIDMSLRGLKVNQRDRAELEAKLEAEVSYYRKLCEEEGFNPASNQQVGYILAKRGNFLPFTRSRKNLKVDEEQLEFLDDPLAQVVLMFRKANKLLTTYIRPLAGEDRIYTEYNLDAIVGRISSSNRNLQNIPPGEPRNIFMPDSGTFTTGDFSQEHLRIMMYKSGDRLMQRVYLEGEMGGDIHEFTARELGIPRKLAKTINYAIAYGATPKTISAQAKIKDLQRCAYFLDKWFQLFRDAAEWIKGVQEEGWRTGWAEPTLFGRRIKLPDESEDSVKRKAVNYPILGSDGEIMKRALIICKKYNLPLAVTVHDSITCDGDIEFPVEELENIAPVHIPFEVKKTLRWE
jgi:DNA polymerase-1